MVTPGQALWLELRPTRMSLEEIFLSLTTEEKNEKDDTEERVPDQPEETGAEQHG